MINHELICRAAAKAAAGYPVKKISYFGSYAAGLATEKSDLDILVEFHSPAISLLTIAEIKHRFEDELHVPVDVLHAPLPEGAFISIGKAVPVYEQ